MPEKSDGVASRKTLEGNEEVFRTSPAMPQTGGFRPGTWEREGNTRCARGESKAPQGLRLLDFDTWRACEIQREAKRKQTVAGPKDVVRVSGT